MSRVAGLARWGPLSIVLAIPCAATAQAQAWNARGYSYQRAIVAERLIKAAIEKRSAQRMVTLYNGIFDEMQVLLDDKLARFDDSCFEAFTALIPVTLLASTRLAPDMQVGGRRPSVAEAAADMDRAWTSYRQRLAVCERELEVMAAVRALPERLSEAF